MVAVSGFTCRGMGVETTWCPCIILSCSLGLTVLPLDFGEVHSNLVVTFIREEPREIPDLGLKKQHPDVSEKNSRVIFGTHIVVSTQKQFDTEDNP